MTLKSRKNLSCELKHISCATGADKLESISLLYEYEPLLYFHSTGTAIATYSEQTFPGNKVLTAFKTSSYTTCRFLCAILIIHLQCERCSDWKMCRKGLVGRPGKCLLTGEQKNVRSNLHICAKRVHIPVT